MVRVLRDPNKKGTGAPRGVATNVTSRVSLGGGLVGKTQVARDSIRRLIARNPAKGTSANIGTEADRVVPSGFVPAVAASLTTAMTGTNNDMVFTSRRAGVVGNSVRVAFIVAGASTPLSIVVAGNDITVNVATNGASAAISTASQVIAAIKASAPASALVNVALKAGEDGTGVVAAFAMTNLTGGAESGPLQGTNSVGQPTPEILNGSKVGRASTPTHKNVVNRGPNRRVRKF